MSEICHHCALAKHRPEGCGTCGSGAPGQVATHEPFTLAPGTVLRGQYEICRLLGSGGFGHTYLAHDRRLDMRVAIKEHLPRDLAGRQADGRVTAPSRDLQAFELTLERFADEGRALARLSDHPNIVSVLTFFRENGTAYLVMGYLEGKTLAERCGQGGVVPEPTAVSVGVAILDGLKTVHASGMVHRDIKPDNVYITDDGLVKLLDFGAARDALRHRNRTMTKLWTEGYAPLEQQTRGAGDVGPWTDVYATGATLYRILTGAKPPDAASDRALDAAPLVSPHDITRGRVSREVSDVVMKALELWPEHRYRSAEAFQEALTRAHGGGPVASIQLEGTRPMRSVAAPRYWTLALGAGAAVTTGLVFAASSALVIGGVLGMVVYPTWSDGAACAEAREARRVAAWQTYLTDFPQGACVEEATVAIRPRVVGADGYGSVLAALEGAIHGVEITLAPGTYTEAISLEEGVTLVGGGSKPEQVVLRPSGGAAVWVKGGSPTLRNLTLQTAPGSEAYAIEVLGGEATLDGVVLPNVLIGRGAGAVVASSVIEGAPADGVVVEGRLTMTDSRSDGHTGAGVVFTGDGASGEIARSRIRENGASGVRVEKGARATLVDLDVRKNGFVQLEVRGAFADVQGGTYAESQRAGIFLTEQATAEVRNARVTGNAYAGLEVSSSTANVHGGRFVDNAQSGIFNHTASTATIKGAAVIGNGMTGVLFKGASGEVQETTCDDNERNGVEVVEGGTLTAREINARGNGDAGVAAVGSTLTIVGGYFERNSRCGVFAKDSETEATEGLYGGNKWGFCVVGGDAALSATTHKENQLDGVAVAEGGAVVLREVVSLGNLDDGIHLAGCGEVDVRSSRFDGNAGHGILATGACMPSVRGSLSSGNGKAGVRLENGAGGTIEGNDLRGNTAGAISASRAGAYQQSNNQE